MAMMRVERRTCDRCGGEIPPGAFYRRFYCKPAVAEVYLGSSPTGRELNGLDGTIRIVLCQNCLIRKEAGTGES